MYRSNKFKRITITALVLIMMTSSCRIQDDLKVPEAKKIKKELKNHGQVRIDNYYWLKDKNNPDVIKYLEDENEYTKESLQHTGKLQELIFEEITERIKPRDESVPFLDNGYYYYHRYEEHKEHQIYCRKKGSLSAFEEILIDVNELAEGFPYYNISDFSVSSNNKFLAYSVDTIGDNKYFVQFKDLATGKILPDKIVETDGEVEWAADNKTIFYIKQDPVTQRGYQLWKHVLGSESKIDKPVYEEKDDSYSLSISKSKSDKYLLLGSHNTISVEFRILQADQPDKNFTLISRREKNHEYYVETHGNEIYILTNSNNASNFRIVKTDINNLHKENWKEVVPHSTDCFIEDFEVFKDYIVVNERKNGLIYLKIINLNDQSVHYLDCGEDVYEIWISENNNYDTEILRFGYSSLTTPTSIFDYDLSKRVKTLVKQKFAGINFNKHNYESKRIFAQNEEGIKIPISLVYKKGIKLDGNNPLLIYAYGSYGLSMDAGFQLELLSLLDRGFVYAIAHVRGGQELGRTWYESGKLLNKKNTFSDFITCTKYLHSEGYSNPKLTYASGESAGGLITGVVSNTHPELYKGIISEMPFVDILTTMLDKSIPLTTGEYDEWGDPNQKIIYDYIFSYSPYDQIKTQDYPAMFIISGLNDSNVQFWEPAKWTAKLREHNTSENPIYLYTIMEAGHNGLSGRYETFKETALMYAFILDNLERK